MNLWDVMVSVFWFMLLLAWFWLMITIISDVLRDSGLSGFAKAAWCMFVILLPWLGVLTYMIARGRSMAERASQQAAENERAFRHYVKDAAGSEGSGLSGELTRLAELRDKGVLTSEEFARAKQRAMEAAGVTSAAPAAPAAPPQPVVPATP